MKRRLHIAYVCSDRGVALGAAKGSSTHVAEMAAALNAQGAEVRIVAARVADDWQPDGTGFGVVDLSRDRSARALRHSLFGNAHTPLRQVRAAEAYALMLNQALARALERLHRQWRIDAVYERYSLWSYAGATFARSERVPFLLEVNAPLREEQKRYRSLANEPMAAALESFLFRDADHVLVPSAALKPYVIHHGARAGGVRVIPNAADPDLLGRDVSPRLRRDGDPFVVGFVGTLKPWHGLEVLVQAFRRLYRRRPDARLLIAGDGPVRRDLQRQIRQLGLRAVTEITGEFPHRHVAELLARMRVGTAPYPRLRGFYFSPLKVFEYMAAGVPIVASRIGQIDELLVHEKTALLHRPGAVAELAACLERIHDDPALANRLQANARRLAVRRHTWERNAARVLTLIAARRRTRSARAAG